MKTLLHLILLLMLTSCSEDQTEIRELTSLNISSPTGKARIDLFTNETLALSVTGFDQDGEQIEIAEAIAWSIEGDHLSVNSEGVISPNSIGTSNVKAVVGEIEASFEITVWDSSAPRTEIYVSDANAFDKGPWQILVYDENGENARVFTKERLAWPQDIVILEDQEIVLISNLNSGSISKHDINSGKFIATFANNIGGPTRMKIGPDNLLYVLQWNGNGFVKRYQLDGTFVDDFTDVGLSQSIGLDWDQEGNLYVSSFQEGTILKFNTKGEFEQTFISSGLTGPTNIWFTDDSFMVNDWTAGSIKKYSTEGSFVETVASGLSQIEGVDFLKNGDFVIGNGGKSEVKLYSSDGNFIKDFIPEGRGGLSQPNAIRVRYVNQD